MVNNIEESFQEEFLRILTMDTELQELCEIGNNRTCPLKDRKGTFEVLEVGFVKYKELMISTLNSVQELPDKDQMKLDMRCAMLAELLDLMIERVSDFELLLNIDQNSRMHNWAGSALEACLAKYTFGGGD